MGRLRFELRTNRLKAECSTAELATPKPPKATVRSRLGPDRGRPMGLKGRYHPEGQTRYRLAADGMANLTGGAPPW